ncbi:MAG: hypothetical protein ABIO48_08350 [Pedococcus sp.]
MDELVGRALVAVERLAWCDANGGSDARTGPVHLHLEGGRGVFFSGETDLTFGAVVTRAGDESWLSPYLYDIEGAQWAIRDAAQEPPFADTLGARLKSWTSVRNEMGEQIGMALEFDEVSVTLTLHEGEVAT